MPSYYAVIDNAKHMLHLQGVEFDLEDMPTIVMEAELCSAFSTYIGDEEAEELQNALVRADIEGVLT